MKKTGIFLVGTVVVAATAATVKLVSSHLNEKEQEKWHKYWEQKHAEAAEARVKVAEAAKEAAEKAKEEVAIFHGNITDTATELAEHVKTVLTNDVPEKEEVLEDLHGALNNYLGKKKDEVSDVVDKVEDAADKASDAVDSAKEEVSSKVEDTVDEAKEVVKDEVPIKTPAPPVDNDSEEEALPAWDVVPVIGEGDGKIDPASEEYVAMLKEAIEKAEKEPTYHLVLGGKTYGLGAKGKSIGGDTAFNLEDLRKLLRKAETNAE